MTTTIKETRPVEVPVGVKLVELDYYNTQHKRGYEPIENNTDDESAYLYLEQKAYHLINSQVFGNILTKIGHDQLEDVVQDFEVVYDDFGNEVSRTAISLPRYGILYYAKQAVAAQINFYIKNGILEEWKRREEVSDSITNFTMSNDEYETTLDTVCKEAWAYAKEADVLLQALNYGMDYDGGVFNSYGLLGRFKDTITNGLTTGDINGQDIVDLIKEWKEGILGSVDEEVIIDTDMVVDKSNRNPQNLNNKYLTQSLNEMNEDIIDTRNTIASIETILATLNLVETETITQVNWPTNTINLVANAEVLLPITNQQNKHINIIASTIFNKVNNKRFRFTGSTSVDLAQAGSFTILLEVYDPIGNVSGLVEIENIRIDQQPQDISWEFTATRSEIMTMAGFDPTTHTDWTGWTLQLLGRATSNGTIGSGGNDNYLSIETTLGKDLVFGDIELTARGVDYDDHLTQIGANNVQEAIEIAYDKYLKLNDDLDQGKKIPLWAFQAIQLSTGQGVYGYEAVLGFDTGKFKIYDKETGLTHSTIDSRDIQYTGATYETLTFTQKLYTGIALKTFTNTIINQFGANITYTNPRLVKLYMSYDNLTILRGYKLAMQGATKSAIIDLSLNSGQATDGDGNTIFSYTITFENLSSVEYLVITFNDTPAQDFTNLEIPFVFSRQGADSSKIFTDETNKAKYVQIANYNTDKNTQSALDLVQDGKIATLENGKVGSATIKTIVVSTSAPTVDDQAILTIVI